MKKILSLLFSAALLLGMASLLISCRDEATTYAPSIEITTTEPPDNFPIPDLRDDAIIMLIPTDSDTEIPENWREIDGFLDSFRGFAVRNDLFYLYFRRLHASTEYRGEELIALVVEQVKDFATFFLLACHFSHDGVDIRLTTEDMERVRDSALRYVNLMRFETLLRAGHLTLDVYFSILALELVLEPRVLAHISNPNNNILSFTDEDVEYFTQNVYRFKHIMLGPDMTMLRSEYLALANELFERLLDREYTFEQLMERYNQDRAMCPTLGYYITREDIIPAIGHSPEFMTAAFSLAIDSNVGVIETERGFHIIRRLAPQVEHVRNYIYPRVMLSDMVTERRNDMTFVFSDLIQYYIG